MIDPLLASTFVGGGQEDWPVAMRLDGEGNVYVAGYTQSSDFPATVGAYDQIRAGDKEIFVCKLAGDLGNLLAHLFFASLMRRRPPADFDELTRHVVGRYQEQAGPVPLRELGFFSTTALFRIVAIHALRTATRRHATTMWALAERVLTSMVQQRSGRRRIACSGPRGRGARPVTPGGQL